MLRVLGSIVFLFTMALCLQAKDEKVPLDKLPKAVTDAVKAKFPKGDG